jgi:putative transposase
VTTNSKHELPVAKNILKQNFSASEPNQKWVLDFAYLWTQEGWLHLATVIDLYSRMIVGWAMSERMKADLVGNAIIMALTKNGLICSMRGTGNCYDNASAESFFRSLKVEAIYGERFEMREKMRPVVFEYNEVDYNRTRRHSTNGQISPVAFEAKQVA